MQAKELRIGNLILNGAGNIIEVSAEKIMLIMLKRMSANPIRITGDWLKKFSQQVRKDEMGSYQFYYLEEPTSYGIDLYGGDFCLTYGGEVTKETYIKYVHQLQNLYFALTDTELTIKE